MPCRCQAGAVDNLAGRFLMCFNVTEEHVMTRLQHFVTKKRVFEPRQPRQQGYQISITYLLNGSVGCKLVCRDFAGDCKEAIEGQFFFEKFNLIERI